MPKTMTQRPELHVLLLDALEAETRINATWYEVRTVSFRTIMEARERGYIELEHENFINYSRLCLTLEGHVVAKDLKERYKP